MSEVLKNLEWRYATKKIDANRPAEEEKVNTVLEAIRLTATSSGLQPFEVLVVKNQELKEKIKPHAWNQEQVTDCSHLLVFAAWDNYTVDRINMMFDLVNEERGFVNEGWEKYRQMILSIYPQRDAETNYAHAARQAYVGLGSALIAAAEVKLDSTPMEGFDPEKVDEILNLKERGLRSVILLPLGYRADDGDWLVNLKKVRRSKEDFVTELS